MRLRLLLVLFSAFVLLSQNRSGQNSFVAPPMSFTVAGVLVERGRNQPVKHARVLLAPVEHRDRQLASLTAEDGRFIFRNLAPGKYALQARTRNVVQEFAENERFATAIAVGPNLDTEHIVFTVSQGATIRGLVSDEDGEPVRNAQVFLFHKGVFDGRARVAVQAQEYTRASGAFYFRKLEPGTYFVAVVARPWYAQWTLPQNDAPQPESSDVDQSGNRAEFNVAYPVTYYADALDPAAASAINLSDGDLADMSINLHPVPAVSVQLETGEPVSMSMSARAIGGVLIPVNGVQYGDDHRRVFGGVAPGRYLVTAETWQEGSPTAVREKEVELSGNTTLDVSQLPETSIAGQIQVDKLEKTEGLMIGLTNLTDGRRAFGRVQADGSFNIPGRSFQPGQYQIQMVNGSEYYMDSIVVKGAPYANGILEMPDGATVRIAIVVRKGARRVDGIALRNGKPFAGAMVLLLPEDASHGTYIPRDQSDSDGTFTLNLAPPGQYKLVAIDDGRGLAYRDSAVIQPYLAKARAIEVPLPGNAPVKVNVQERLR